MCDTFEDAAKWIQNLPKDGPVKPSDDEKLQVYSLYKQATEGDNSRPRPGMFALVEKKKWDAWDAHRGMSQDDAKEKYRLLIKGFYDKAQ